MLHWLIIVLCTKPVHSFHMVHLSKAKHCWSMSHIVQNQLYPMTQTPQAWKFPSRLSGPLIHCCLLGSWSRRLYSRSLLSPLRTRCSKWINHVTVKHFSEERFAGYLDIPLGTVWEFQLWFSSSIWLFSP